MGTQQTDCRVKVIFGLKQASWGGLGVWLRRFPLTSLWRYSGHAHVGGDPGADPEHTRGISCPIWHGPKRSWRMWLKKWMSKLLCLVGCNRDLSPGSEAENGSFGQKSWRFKSLVGLLKAKKKKKKTANKTKVRGCSFIYSTHSTVKHFESPHPIKVIWKLEYHILFKTKSSGPVEWGMEQFLHTKKNTQHCYALHLHPVEKQNITKVFVLACSVGTMLYFFPTTETFNFPLCLSTKGRCGCIDHKSYT